MPIPTTISIPELAKAVAVAEGYRPGTKPFVSNNPGSLFPGGKWGVYKTPKDGWAALEALLQRAARAKGMYARAHTWRDFAWMYVNGTLPNKAIIHESDRVQGGPEVWAKNVLRALGSSCTLDCAWKANLQ